MVSAVRIRVIRVRVSVRVRICHPNVCRPKWFVAQTSSDLWNYDCIYRACLQSVAR